MISLTNPEIWIKQISKDRFVVCCGHEDEYLYPMSYELSVDAARYAEKYYDSINELRECLKNQLGEK